MTPRVVRCGDAALTIHFDAKPSASLARRIASLHEALHAEPLAGVAETVPGLTSLTVLFDPALTRARILEDALKEYLADRGASVHSPRRWRIPACYEGDLAPDLAEVARRCGLDSADVVAAHAEREYTVYLLGFSPGFPYMGDVDPRLVLPRRAQPRVQVPAGSIAIADGYTAIYPQQTPGGWHILGATPVRLFDPERKPPALLASGDIVTFTPVDRAAYETLKREFDAGRTLSPS